VQPVHFVEAAEPCLGEHRARCEHQGNAHRGDADNAGVVEQRHTHGPELRRNIQDWIGEKP